MQQDYSVNIKGHVYIGIGPQENAGLQFIVSTVIHDMSSAFEAAHQAVKYFAERLDLPTTDIEVTHIDVIPAGER